MSTAAVETLVRHVAIAGNPNCGKSTIFNALTGLRQKVGNYPGVTVEEKTGRLFRQPWRADGSARSARQLQPAGAFAG